MSIAPLPPPLALIGLAAPGPAVDTIMPKQRSPRAANGRARSITLKSRFEKGEAACLKKYADEVGEDVSTYLRNAAVLRHAQIDEDRALGHLITAVVDVTSRFTFVRIDRHGAHLDGAVDFVDDTMNAPPDCKEHRASNAIRTR